jgi:DNA-binding response OmpR family regulator
MTDRPPRILLVDDEQPIQTLLSFPLQKDGYEVVQASDGRRRSPASASRPSTSWSST